MHVERGAAEWKHVCTGGPAANGTPSTSHLRRDASVIETCDEERAQNVFFGCHVTLPDRSEGTTPSD